MKKEQKQKTEIANSVDPDEMAHYKPPLLDLNYSQLSLSRSGRDHLKHFEISVLRHIRCAELRKIHSNNRIPQMNI